MNVAKPRHLDGRYCGRSSGHRGGKDVVGGRIGREVEDVANRGERRGRVCEFSSLSLRPGSILIHVDDGKGDQQEKEVQLHQEEKGRNQELVVVLGSMPLHKRSLGCYALLLIL